MSTTKPSGVTKGGIPLANSGSDVDLDDSDIVLEGEEAGARKPAPTAAPAPAKVSAKPEPAKPRPTLPDKMKPEVLRIFSRGGRDAIALFQAIKAAKESGAEGDKAIEALTPAILKITEGKPEMEAYALLCLTAAAAMRVTFDETDKRSASAVKASGAVIRGEMTAGIEAVKALLPNTFGERLFGKKKPKTPKAAK